MEIVEKLSEEERYARAVLRVKELKAFYGHLTAYCIVIPILIYINLKTSAEFHWFWFPILGWGFGLLILGLQVFIKTTKWEERKIQEYMNDENF